MAQSVFASKARGLALQRVLGVLMDEVGNDAGPSRLVLSTESFAGVAVEIFVEQDEIAPVRIGLEHAALAVGRALAGIVPEEKADQPPREVGRHVPQGNLVA